MRSRESFWSRQLRLKSLSVALCSVPASKHPPDRLQQPCLHLRWCWWLPASNSSVNVCCESGMGRCDRLFGSSVVSIRLRFSEHPVAAPIHGVTVAVSAKFGCGTFQIESANEFGRMSRKPLRPARLFGTKLNQARLQSISLQKRPKLILDACRFGIVGTAIPRSWYRCSAYPVLHGVSGC